MSDRYDVYHPSSCIHYFEGTFHELLQSSPTFNQMTQEQSSGHSGGDNSTETTHLKNQREVRESSINDVNDHDRSNMNAKQNEINIDDDCDDDDDGFSFMKHTVLSAEDSDAMEQSAVDGDAMEQSAVDGNAMEQSAVDGDAMEQSAVDGDAMEQSAVDGDAMEQSAVGKID